MDDIILVLAFLAFVIFTVFLGVRIVPQGRKDVVERLGKYNHTMNAGLNFIFPYIDRVAYQVPTKDLIIDTDKQDVITRDNAVVQVNAVGFINVARPDKAVYGIENYEQGVRNLIQTSLRSIIGEMKLDDALSNREQIKTKLKNGIADDLSAWGISLRGVEIQDVNPAPSMQKAMEAQAAAERERRATVARAEGDKEAAILDAEGRLESAKRDAEAKIVLAQGSKEAIEKVLSMTKDQPELAIQYLVAERYIQAIQEQASSPGAKTILLPADLQATVGGLLGKLK